MTSKEFEVMRNAQKHETDLAVLRKLSEIKADISMYEADCNLALSENDENCLRCNKVMFGSIYRLIDNHIKEIEE